MKKTPRGVFLFPLTVLVIAMFVPSTPPPVDQHFKVVAGISPPQLEQELKKLNAAGYTLDLNTLKVVQVGDKLTIVVTYDGEVKEDEGAGK